MRHAVLIAAAALAWLELFAAAPAAAMDLPPAAACDAAARAAGASWQGRFSGRRRDFFDRMEMVFVEGCFASEYLCRRWLNEVQTAVEIPGLMSCGKLRGNR